MSDCILWPGRLARTGYVHVWLDGRQQLAHRLIWEQRHGPIPDGLTVDHICENKACLNPEHYQLVSGPENTRLWARRRTHCKNGHLLDQANTFQYRTSGGYTGRGCVSCRAEASRLWRQRKASGQ